MLLFTYVCGAPFGGCAGVRGPDLNGTTDWVDGLLCTLGRSPDSVDYDPTLGKETYREGTIMRNRYTGIEVLTAKTDKKGSSGPRTV